MPDKDTTPFTLRMNCLHMAETMLTQRMHMTKEVYGNEGTMFFTTEDVMAEAGKLYAFVCDKNASVNFARPKG